MSTLVNVAVSSVVSALGATPAVCQSIDRVRRRPVALQVAQSVAVRPVQAEAGQALLPNGEPVSWTTTLAVDLYARATPGTSPDVAVDALLEAVYTRLMQDNTLGGAVVALVPQGVSYDFDADGDQTACASLVFLARHRGGATFS